METENNSYYCPIYLYLSLHILPSFLPSFSAEYGNFVKMVFLNLSK